MILELGYVMRVELGLPVGMVEPPTAFPYPRGGIIPASLVAATDGDTWLDGSGVMGV